MVSTIGVIWRATIRMVVDIEWWMITTIYGIVWRATIWMVGEA